MHEAIKASIDYWSTQIGPLLAEPPLHTTFYAVKEDGALKVYGVKWNGADLTKCKVFTPADEPELLAQLEAQRSSFWGDIGDALPTSDDRVYSIDCFVYNSPLRKVAKWLPSIATSILNDERLPATARTIAIPSGSRLLVNKLSQRIRFEDESERSVTIVVEQL